MSEPTLHETTLPPDGESELEKQLGINLDDETSVFDRYMELKSVVRDATEAMKAIEPAVIQFLSLYPEARTERYGFELRTEQRRRYEYSPIVQNLERQLKQARSHERAHNLASVSGVTEFVKIQRAPRRD